MGAPILFAERDPLELAASEIFSVPRIGGSFSRQLASEEATNPFSRLSFLNIQGDPHPSKILRDKSESDEKLGELYTRMLKDTELGGYVDKRIDAVLKLPRRIAPADGKPLAMETALFARAALRGIPNFDINLRHQAMRFWYGLAVDEVMIEKLSRGPLAGAWVPVDLIDRPMHRFAFKKGELYIVKGSGALELAPTENFLVARHGTKDNSWGKPDADDCYWPWWLKKNGLKFWAIFLDKYGMPTAIGHYASKRSGSGGAEGPNTSQGAQQALHEVLQRIQTEYAITLPDGLDIKFLEAQRSGGVSYEQFIEMLNRAMAVKILGEVDTSGAAKGPGSFAKSEISNEVRIEKVVLDAHNLSAHLTDNFLRPMIAWNFGPDAPVPTFEIDAVDAEARAQRASGIEAILEMEEPVGRRYAYMTHQVPEPGEGEPVIRRKKEKPLVPVIPPPPAVGTPGPDESIGEGDTGDGTDSKKASRMERRRERRTAAAAHHRGAGGPTPSPATNRLASAPANDFDPAAVEVEIEALIEQARERDAEFDQVSAVFIEPTLSYYGGWREELIAAFDSGDVARGTALRRIVGAVNPLDSARALETAQIHGMGLALSHFGEDVGLDHLKRLWLPDGWENETDPQSASGYWEQQLVIPKDVFLGLSDNNRRLAFTVVGVTDLDLLQGIYELIGEAIAGGWSRLTFVGAVDQLFLSKGVDPLSRWHAELVYAQNVRNAANLMRFQQLVLNPAARRLTPYLTWCTLEQNTRPTHHVMRGYTAAIGHEIWRTWWPLAGFGCNCSIGAINLVKARKLGLVGSEPMGPWPTYLGAEVMPDEGFAGAPATVFEPVIDDMQRRAEQALRDAQNSGDPDFSDAAQQLFDQLYGGLTDSQTSFASIVMPTVMQRAA